VQNKLNKVVQRRGDLPAKGRRLLADAAKQKGMSDILCKRLRAAEKAAEEAAKKD
jgi:hypothetical protein